MMQQGESKQQQTSLLEMNDLNDSSLVHIELKNNKYTCSICDKNFSSKWNLKEHIQIHTNEKPFTCGDCKKLFTRKRELRKHMMTYGTTSPVVCEICKLSFTRKCALITHMKTHSNKKLFKCEKCEKTFDYRYKLNKHMIIHNQPQLHCNECRKSFSRENRLNRHLKVHQIQHRPLFKCEKCEKTFDYRYRLNKHMFSHNHPQLPCNECEKTFSSEDRLKHHLKVHQNQHYTCDQCKQKFRQKSNLNQHLRTHHTKKPLVPVRDEISLPSVEFKRLRHQTSAFGVFKTLTFCPEKNEEGCLITFQTNLKPELQYNLQNEIREKKAIKWFMVSKVLFERERGEGDIETITSYFRSDCYIVLVENSITDHIDEGYSKINQSFEEFNSQGSDWRLREIDCLELNISKYNPLAKN